ncbi:MAG: type I-C CRISPR-associated protein Cas8c/Csd1 [Bacteriovoracaceae bacterium]|nr:type I-C CRISPR-associated protein Cas8c/Csd1 [Bacteroidota bacterium]
MILQALYDYYERKPKIHNPVGYEKEELDFIVLIKKTGTFVDLINMRENNRGHEYAVPKAVIRTAEAKPNLLWDKLEYIFGISKEKSSKKTANAKKYNRTFVDKLKNLPKTVKVDEGVKAVISFYKKNQIKKIKKHLLWDECLKINGWISFQLENDSRIIPARKIVQEYQKTEFLSGKTDDDPIEGTCLITGETGIIARLHSEMRLRGSDKNVKIVAFQKNSGFDSYGKEQAYNSPISVLAEAKYSTALKYLLNSSLNRTFISDVTIIFWSDKTPQSIDLEEVVSWVVATQKIDEESPDSKVQVVKALYNSVLTGRLSQEKDNRFYVLALAPNAARISVRFWRTGTVEEFGKRIYQHFEDFKIAHGPKEPDHLSLYQILSSTAFQYKMENVPPNLTGKVVESILDGTPYPVTLMQQCMRRIRAERQVNRPRAAILKAYINRFNRIHKSKEKEILMALDLTNTNSGYRIGRLFAVLEKIQEEASPNINSTIRDRFYGAASSSPVAVFSQLLKLKNHHLAKLEIGHKIYFEKLIGEVMSELSLFPAHLSLDEQAYFSVGYYHQRQDFFTSKKNKIESEQQ